MTDLLRKAFQEAAELPPCMQDAIAAFVLAELNSDYLWDEALGGGPPLMETLASHAVMGGGGGNGRGRRRKRA
jgi:hypothetical protein